ncbi:MAG: terminase large subunit [Kiritimatiellae bacterium]|nr:terminase large subunit [Kiritimatiellia bacterium]
MTALEEYFGSLLDGRIRACDKMKRVSEILLERLASPGVYHFDADIAARHIGFIEDVCRQPTGQARPLKLELFQKARLEAIFGFVDDNGMRQCQEVLTIEGRKNGKTTEASAVELDVLINDGEVAPQIYNVATQREQARLGFDACDRMRLFSPLLKKHIKKRASDLYYPANKGIIKALASNTNSLDGLDTHCGVIDELAAIKNRDLYDLIKQSMLARRQPLLFCNTTNGFVRGSIFDAQYEYAEKWLKGEAENDRFLAFIYELDSAEEWDDPEAWIKANPGLGTIKRTDMLAANVQKAKDDPAFKPTVMVKDFNIKQTADSAWLRFEDTVSGVAELGDYRFDYAIGGFDAADTTDLNAATALCMRPGDDKIYRRSMYWIPESVLKDEDKTGNRRGRDSAPYRLWIDQGWMRTCPGNKCDKHIFLDWFRELKYSDELYVMYIGYDPWHVDDSLLADFRGEFGPNAMIPVRQGVISLSQPMKDTKADLQAKRVVFDSPIDQWCLINTTIRTDVNGNIQPVKTSDRTQRIDGTAAYLCAYKVLRDKAGEYINMNEEAE